MNKKEAFDILDRLAEGIAKTFGSSCKTVIHDVKNRKDLLPQYIMVT